MSATVTRPVSTARRWRTRRQARTNSIRLSPLLPHVGPTGERARNLLGASGSLRLVRALLFWMVLDNAERGELTSAEMTDAVVTGVRWFMIARVVSDGLMFFSAAALARMVAPPEFGRAAVALIFLPLAVILTYEGFGSALVQRREITRAHLEAAALSSIVAGAVASALTFTLAPVVLAPVFGDETAHLIQLVSPVFLLAALSTPSRALLARDLNFRRISM